MTTDTTARFEDLSTTELQDVEGGSAAGDAGRVAGQIVGCTAWFLGGWIFDMDGSVLCHD
jgi:hypothetical protein